MSEPTKCRKCGKWFEPIPEMRNVSCCVLHPPGTCCHYSDREVPTPATPLPAPDLMDEVVGRVREALKCSRAGLFECVHGDHYLEREDVASLLAAYQSVRSERDALREDAEMWRSIKAMHPPRTGGTE